MWDRWQRGEPMSSIGRHFNRAGIKIPLVAKLSFRPIAQRVPISARASEVEDRSPTWDRGSEMAERRKFTMATQIDVFSCDPQSPWQCGSNENTNRHLRQYCPKGMDISGFSQA